MVEEDGLVGHGFIARDSEMQHELLSCFVCVCVNVIVMVKHEWMNQVQVICFHYLSCVVSGNPWMTIELLLPTCLCVHLKI